MEHPFARFIQILGKGRRGARSLTEEEAEAAMEMLLAGSVRPEQVGAFLSLLRLKEEIPAEVAGMVRALRRARLPAMGQVDLDWPSYAGKRRQLPWYVLSAWLLAQQKIRILMHGLASGDSGRCYVPDALVAMGLPVAHSLSQAMEHLDACSFAFLPVSGFSPHLQRWLDLKSILGLRSPIHSVARMVNPGHPQTSFMGIFHPGYDRVHREAAILLEDAGMMVFKGEGGEAEINPDGVTEVSLVRAGNARLIVRPARFVQRHLRDDEMDCRRLMALWEGREEDEYARAAVCETAALALVAMGRYDDPDHAREWVDHCWAERDRGSLKGFSLQQRISVGKVFLVGAGPGDPDLLTVKAQRCIQQAQVVVHDNLVSQAILDQIPSGVQRIYVGKQRGNHTLAQEGINALLVRLAHTGQRVVRLKGGDPFIFGRGGEEIETLAEQGISFEVVPGITAASGIAAYAGIPLTHRDYAQSCVFVTGHMKEGTQEDMDWESLARPQQTLVVYMGLQGLERLCRELSRHGLPSTTPAAIIQQGTTRRQRVVVGDLATLPELACRESLQAPTLIIVGGVVTLHRTLRWFQPEMAMAN